MCYLCPMTKCNTYPICIWRSWIAIIFLLNCYHLMGQIPQNVDSLQTLLTTEITDKTRVDILNHLSGVYFDSQKDKAMAYGKEALALANKINYGSGKTIANFRLGSTYLSQDDYLPAIEHLNQVLQFKEELKSHILLIVVYKSLGAAYFGLGDNAEGVKQFYNAMKVADSHHDTMNYRFIKKYLVLIPGSNLDTLEVLQMHLEDIETWQKQGKEIQLRNEYQMISEVYHALDSLTPALQFALKCHQIHP